MLKRKILLICIIVIVIALGLSLLYFLKSPPEKLLTYRNSSVPFTFSYPKAWKIVKKAEKVKETNQVSTLLTAIDSDSEQSILSIRYDFFGVFIASNLMPGETNCVLKQGDYTRKCSYVANPSMNYGYLYHRVDTRTWLGNSHTYEIINGKKVKKIVGLTLTLLDKSESSEAKLKELAKSIRISSESPKYGCKTFSGKKYCVSDYTGLSEQQAITKGQSESLTVRIIQTDDGRDIAVDDNIAPKRINLTLVDGKVSKARFY